MSKDNNKNEDDPILEHKFRCSYCGHYYYNECDCNGYEDNRGR